MVISRLRIVVALEMLILVLSASILFYGILKSSGLFTPASGSLVRALHEQQPQTALYVLIATTLVLMALKGKSLRQGMGFLFWTGIVVMATGLVLSSFFRFEGRIVLTEGQTFSGDPEEYVPNTLYAGKRASLPTFRLEANVVSPRISKSGSLAERITLQANYQQGTAPAREITIDSLLPAMRDGFLLRTTGFGYSPLYQVRDETGLIVEDSFVSLAIFPPGREDRIISRDIPHTFYVRYFPDGTVDRQQGSDEKLRIPGPVFLLRVMRNLDLSYRGYIHIQEEVKIGPMIFSFQDVRKWAEISVVKDHGLTVFFAGALMTGATIISRFRQRRSNLLAGDIRSGGHHI